VETYGRDQQPKVGDVETGRAKPLLASDLLSERVVDAEYREVSEPAEGPAMELVATAPMKLAVATMIFNRPVAITPPDGWLPLRSDSRNINVYIRGDVKPGSYFWKLAPAIDGETGAPLPLPDSAYGSLVEIPEMMVALVLPQERAPAPKPAVVPVNDSGLGGLRLR
jgi:hypothetical protein